jgi:hypothetical protein
MHADSPRKTLTFLFLIACLAVGLTSAVACSHPTTKGQNGGTDAASCEPGTERCTCAAGNECQGTLVCASGLCVQLPGSGSGGSSGGDGGAAGGGDQDGGGTGSGGSSDGGGSGGSGGPNLIDNGNFSNGDTNWKVIINSGNTTDNHTVMNNQFCLSVNSGSNVTIGWGNTASPLMLSTGINYTFAFKASASPAAGTFHSKVGQAVQPYATDEEQDETGVGTSLTPFSHMFTVTTPDTNTGIAFVVNGPGQGSSMVCVSDVSITAGN